MFLPLFQIYFYYSFSFSFSLVSCFDIIHRTTATKLRWSYSVETVFFPCAHRFVSSFEYRSRNCQRTRSGMSVPIYPRTGDRRKVSFPFRARNTKNRNVQRGVIRDYRGEKRTNISARIVITIAAHRENIEKSENIDIERGACKRQQVYSS